MTSMRSTSGVDWAGLVASLKTSKRWTSAQLAEAIGASAPSIGGWLSGKSKPGPEFAARLTALAGLTAPAEGKRVSAAKAPAGAESRGPGRRLQAVQPSASTSSATLAADPDPVHAAIMGDHTLTDAQRSAVASLRIEFQEMAR